jgi:hypothetical protein
LTTLPRVSVPKGATLRQWNGKSVCIPFSQVPHFSEEDAPPRPPRGGRPLLVVPAPPIGAHLL